MPGGIALHRQGIRRRRHGRREGRFQPDAGMQPFRRLQAHHDDGIGRGDEILGGNRFPSPPERSPRHGRGEVQFAPVGADFAFVLITDPQGPQRHIGFAEMSLHAPLQALRFGVVFLRERLPDQRDGCGGIGPLPVLQVRVRGAPVGLPRPERDVVQGDAVLLRTAIDQGAQPAVADRQGLFQTGGGLVIMQLQFRLRSASARQQAGQQYRHNRISHNRQAFSQR